MKAIYSILNKTIYRLDQDTSEPQTLASMPTNEHSMVNADTTLKKVTASIFLNTMETSNIKSNKELYTQLKNTIEKYSITDVPKIYNRYMLLIDYQLFDSKCEICHNVVTKPITASDAVILLGVAVNNELVYRRVKQFDPIIEFAVANQLPLGIMKIADTNYHFKINDISIYQDASRIPGCCHNSVYCVPYSMNSCGTVMDSLDGFVKIYSTAALGIKISDIDIGFIPKTIDIKINLTMANLIVAYDDTDIVTLIQDIIRRKYHPHQDPETPDTGDDSHEQHMFPDDHRPADGSVVPNRDGWYDYYEKCEPTNPGALKVVENAIPVDIYDPETMIRKKLVVKDIPDIEIGEYVRYVEGYDDTNPHHYHHHEHDHDHHSSSQVSPINIEGGSSVFDGFEEDTDEGSSIGDLIHSIPSARDRGATLDNSDTASNMTTNMNGFEVVDLNDILT